MDDSAEQPGRARRQIARNTLLNLAGNVVPLVVGVGAIPVIIRRMGVDEFGVLSFAWAILGYFTLFDLGLGRATTKYIAQAIGERRFHGIPALVWTSMILSTGFGLIGSVVMIAIAGTLAERVFNVPAILVADTKRTFQVLAAALPAVLVSNTLRGALEADQRFGAVNAVKIPATAAMFALPLVGVLAGAGLVGVVVLLALSRLATAVAFFVLSANAFPSVWIPRNVDRAVLGPLLTYGGWVTASNFLGPVLTYLDRFLLAAVVSAAAVAYYTAPYELVTRLWVFPVSLVAALFPAFSTGAAAGGAMRFYKPAMKYLLVVMGPMVIVIALFARDILQLWLGPEFAAQSAAALAILSIGVLVNSLAQIPFTLLQGVGRADIPAKFYALELPVYALVAWVLVRRYGVTGAACAWTLRVAGDAFLQFVAAERLAGTRSADPSLWRLVGLLTALACAAFAVTMALGAIPVQTAVMALLLSAFAVMVWWWVFSPDDRARVLSLLAADLRASR